MSRTQVHTASFDLENGRMLEGLQPVVEPSHQGTSFGVWSPDGSRLAYLAAEGSETRLVIRSLTGEALQDRPVPLERVRALLAWGEIGLMIQGEDSSGRSGLFSISPETAAVTLVTDEPREAITTACQCGRWALTEDGSRLRINEQKGVQWGPIIERDLATGEERVLIEQELVYGGESPFFVEESHPNRTFISNNGRFVAQGLNIDGDRHYRVIDVSTGEIHRTSMPLRSYDPGSMRFSRDGRYMLFRGWPADEERGYLYRLSLEDDSVLKLMELTEDAGGMRRLSVSPDGRHVVTLAGAARREIWRMSFNEGGRG